MPGTIYEGQAFGPNMVFQEGDIFIGCSFKYGTVFGIGSVFDGCQLLGNSCYNCNPYITTGFGNVFGNTTGACTFYYVNFGPENILHQGWVDSGNNTRGTEGNYGDPPVDGVKKGILKTNQVCGDGGADSGSDSGSDSGIELVKLCFTGEKKTWNGDVITGDRKTGLGGGTGS